MRINWKNIYGILGVIFAIWLFNKSKQLIVNYIEAAYDNHEFWDKHQALPFLILALICVTAVAIFKIRSERKR
jgi:hypothetical protein